MPLDEVLKSSASTASLISRHHNIVQESLTIEPEHEYIDVPIISMLEAEGSILDEATATLLD